MPRAPLLKEIYRVLFKAFGPQRWWPAESPFEVMVGAILTQNTNWGNVEKAVVNLKKKKCLSAESLREIPLHELASLIKPAGYFNVKAKRLKNFIQFFFDEYDGKIERMKKEPLAGLREKLLKVNGIGPETADSILLYALGKPIFVVDAYTRRVLYRHNMIKKDADYHSVQRMFQEGLESPVALFNEYHALLVRLGKDFCKPKALCQQCPLNRLNYSLIYKCQNCHRALLKAKERVPVKRQPHLTFLCSDCVLEPSLAIVTNPIQEKKIYIL